jgi:capsid protein
VTIGRWLYHNSPELRGAVREMADLAASSYIPQFYGSDKVWGNKAEEWLYEHDKICDVRGWPYNMATYRRNLVLAVLRDCDLGTLLTETPEGYPLIQPLGAHRIGSGSGSERVAGGEFDGANIYDGVITDDYGRTIGYRICDPATGAPDRDISANDMFLSFLPEYVDQGRGISELAAAFFDFQDTRESRTFNLLAGKIAASIALVEKNETGEADSAKAIVSGGEYDADDNTKSTIHQETVDGGMIRYFKAGTGSSIESFSYDRPGANSQEFEDRVIRAAFAGMGWSYDFSLNPTKAGGAQMRIVIDKINRRLKSIQDLVLLPAMRRIDGWRISKAIKLGLLAPSKEWYMWDYQGPSRLTADAKYESDVDLQELGAGVGTLASAAARRGTYWEDVRGQQDKEVTDLLTRATIQAKKFGISLEQAITLYRQVGNYSTITNSTPEPADAKLSEE